MKKTVIFGSGGAAKEILNMIVAGADYWGIDPYDWRLKTVEVDITDLSNKIIKEFSIDKSFIPFSLDNIESFIDISIKDPIFNIPVNDESYFDVKKHKVIISTADPVIRKKIVSKLPEDTEYITLKSRSAQIAPTAKIGKGSIINMNSVINWDAEIGDFAQINIGCTVGHDLKAGSYLTMSPVSSIGGCCEIGDEVFFGAHSSCIQNVKLSSGVYLGANACAVKDLDVKGIYVGTPARFVLPKVLSNDEVNNKKEKYQIKRISTVD